MNNTRLYRARHCYDLNKLNREVALARSILDFDSGPYGHAISLPACDELKPEFQQHQNNIPFAGVLSNCPYLREIFESFRTDKAAYRLLRRPARSAYALHDDKDKGVKVQRFQIPIATNRRSWLLIAWENAAYDLFEAEAAQAAQRAGDIEYSLERLDRVLDGKFDLYTLVPGYIHYFDTNQIHTLINAGSEERIVLSLDLVANPWLDAWMASELMLSVEPDPVVRSPDVGWCWNALRNGLIRNI